MMKIGVFSNGFSADKLPVVKHLFDKLLRMEAAVFVQSSFYDYLSATYFYVPYNINVIGQGGFDLDFAISVGGDGTFLRTAVEINRQNIPILGINTGRLGFLADVGSRQIDEALDELMCGDYKIEERTLLELHDEKQIFGDFPYALNEIAVLKRDTSSMITIHAQLDGDYLASYQADGLVVATPTGSTAYSMSVNGPILLPESRNFVLSPVAPHSLTVRPIVIPDHLEIVLKVKSRTNSFLVSLDGRSEDFSIGEMLKIRKADFKTLLIKRLNHTFYQTLREKLMWGMDRRG